MMLSENLPESFIYDAPVVDSSDQHGISYTCVPSPLRNGFRFSFKCYKPIAAPIIRLCNSVSPIAVARRVSLVVVSPFYAVFWGWLQTHVVDKVFKGVYPPAANLYPPPPISVVSVVILIVASAFYSTPCRTFRCFRKAVGCTPTNGGGTQCAPAGLSVPANKVTTRYYFVFPAVAQTVPCGFFAFVWGARNNRKAVKFLIRKVNKFRHNFLSEIAQRSNVANQSEFRSFRFDALATTRVYHAS